MNETAPGPRAEPLPAPDVPEAEASEETPPRVQIFRTIDRDGTVRYTVVPAPEGSEPPPAAAAPSGAPGDVDVTRAPSETPSVAAPGDSPRTRAGTPANVDGAAAGQIELLRAQIQKDREVLRRIISRPGFDADAFSKDPLLREIAERLPRLQAELAALEAERP